MTNDEDWDEEERIYDESLEPYMNSTQVPLDFPKLRPILKKFGTPPEENEAELRALLDYYYELLEYGLANEPESRAILSAMHSILEFLGDDMVIEGYDYSSR